MKNQIMFVEVANIPKQKVYLETEHELNRLYETKKHYEWVRNMYTERTERFEPPMWEDLTDFQFHFFTKTNEGIVKHMCFLAIKTETFKEIILKDEFFDNYEIYDTHANKENYEKACEIVRDLFGGGAK